MKVVLRQDVEHLGHRGEVVNVAPGYARNYLLPKGIAWEASPGNLRTLELQRKAQEKHDLKDVELARDVASRLAGIQLTIAKKAGESDTLYGSVTSTEIADLLSAQGIEIDRRKIRLAEPIRTLGTFQVPIRLHGQVAAEVRIEVVAEAETT